MGVVNGGAEVVGGWGGLGLFLWSQPHVCIHQPQGHDSCLEEGSADAGITSSTELDSIDDLKASHDGIIE